MRSWCNGRASGGVIVNQKPKNRCQKHATCHGQPTNIVKYFYRTLSKLSMLLSVSHFHPNLRDSMMGARRPRATALGRKVGGLIWIRFAAKALRFSIAKSSRPPFKMGQCKVKSTIISRFKSFQVLATQQSRIHRPHPDVNDGNWVGESQYSQTQLLRLHLSPPVNYEAPPGAAASKGARLIHSRPMYEASILASLSPGFSAAALSLYLPCYKFARFSIHCLLLFANSC